MRIFKLLVFGIALIFVSIGNFAHAQTWQQILSQQFDIADTFDHYQDYRQDVTNYSAYETRESDHLPKYADDSPGIWHSFVDNRLTDDGSLWITDHGADKQIGAKSLKMRTDGHSANEIKTYIGDGNPDSGYSDIYVFFRLYLPRNTFPTNIVKSSNTQGIMGNKADEPFLWLTSWKFFNIGTGFNDAYNWNNQGFKVYGDAETWFHIISNYDRNYQSMRLATLNQSRIDLARPPITFDELGGIEYHIKLESPAGANNGVAEVWWYNRNGSVTKIMSVTNLSFRPSNGTGHLINRLWIGGNKHLYDPSVHPEGWTTGEYLCGTGMNCRMYVDDFIVDDQRIGPKYFNLLSGNADILAPNPPRSPKVQ